MVMHRSIYKCLILFNASVLLVLGQAALTDDIDTFNDTDISTDAKIYAG